jgi:hypothetical protein
LKHANADALSRNPVGQATDDDDFSGEIQDTLTDTSKREGETLFVRTGEEIEWLNVRRKDGECVQHHSYCDHVSNHQLYMVDVVSEEDQAKELVPYGAETVRGSELVQDEDVRVVLKRRRP